MSDGSECDFVMQQRQAMADSRGGHFFGDQREKSVFKACRGFSGLTAQIVERTFGDEAATGDNADPIGHALGHFENVRRHYNGAARTHALAQHVLHLARRAGIKSGQELVEISASDRERVHRPAPPSGACLGKSLAALTRVRFETEPADQLASAGFRGGGFGAPEPSNEFEILVRRQLS